jgi:hypothetical protein
VDLRLPVGVAAELQPAIQLAMVGEQAAATIGGENPGRARDVPRPTRPLKAICVLVNESAHPVDNVGLRRKELAVTR